MSITDLISTLHIKDSITLTLNSQFLTHNFQIVKQCLLRIKDIQNTLSKQKQNSSNLSNTIKAMQTQIQNNQHRIQENSGKIKQLSNNVGDQFMKKMYAIEEKTKNMYDFEETTRRMEELNKFVLLTNYKQDRKDIDSQIASVWKLKQEFQRYVSKADFGDYQKQTFSIFQEKQAFIEKGQNQIKQLEQKIKKIINSVEEFNSQLQRNNSMLKEINFPEMMEKMKTVKEDMDHKLAEFLQKIKKKVGVNDLFSFEKIMVDKLDRFLGDNQKNKAEKIETKEALLFLEKKIIEIEAIIAEKLFDDKDALFSSKKWQCASCSKDLGRYQGKLGQYLPWSVFPCKEPDPEKSGGFGYLNYIDKTAYRRGVDLEDQNMERLNKSFNDSKQTPRKLNSTKASNLISNFGTQERRLSLKDAYFRDVISEKGERAPSRQFRVLKKEVPKQSSQQDKKQVQNQPKL